MKSVFYLWSAGSRTRVLSTACTPTLLGLQTRYNLCIILNASSLWLLRVWARTTFFSYLAAKTGLEPAIALVIGCVSHTPLDLVTLIQVYD